MGLLTDPRAGTGKIIKLLLKWEKPLCFTLYAGGAIWLIFLALPVLNDSTFPRNENTAETRYRRVIEQLRSFTHKLHLHLSDTYYSENALLPGLVTKESNIEHTSKQYYHELAYEMTRYPDNMPYAWLLAKFSQLHLEVYTHNFSLIYPFQEQKVRRNNTQ